MALGRTVLMAWLLAVLSVAQTQNAAYSEITASVGNDVTLPCRCYNTTLRAVWQVGNTVVYHYKKAAKTHEPGPSYKNRGLFLNIEEGQCSLHMPKVSELDQKNYTCFTIDENGRVNEDYVYLTVNGKFIGDPTQSTDPTWRQDKNMVGTSVLLVAVMVIILAFIIIGILLMRRRCQNNRRMENHLDPQPGLPIMYHSPV